MKITTAMRAGMVAARRRSGAGGVARRDRRLGWLAGAVFLLAMGMVQHQLARVGSGELGGVDVPPTMIGVSVDVPLVRAFLGVRLMVADLLWIDTLIKSDIKHEPEPFTPIYRAFRTITRLNPENVLAFAVAGMYLSVIKDDIRGATAILREGVEAMRTGVAPSTWSGAWQVPFALGYNLIFEEHDVEGGSPWVMQAGAMPGAPPYVVSLAKKVTTEYGQLEVASRLLTDMYRKVTREDEKRQIEKKLVDIAVRQELYELNEKFTEFLRTTGADAFAKQKQLQLFLRTISHNGRDMLGRRLGINAVGKIGVNAVEISK